MEFEPGTLPKGDEVRIPLSILRVMEFEPGTLPKGDEVRIPLSSKAKSHGP